MSSFPTRASVNNCWFRFLFGVGVTIVTGYTWRKKPNSHFSTSRIINVRDDEYYVWRFEEVEFLKTKSTMNGRRAMNMHIKCRKYFNGLWQPAGWNEKKEKQKTKINCKLATFTVNDHKIHQVHARTADHTKSPSLTFILPVKKKKKEKTKECKKH